MLLTRRLERARPAAARLRLQRLRHRASGRSPTVGLAIAQGRLSLDDLFAQDMLGDDLEAWLAEIGADEAHLPRLRHHRRAYRAPPSGPAQIPAGRSPSRPTSSTTCCARHEPDHILLRAAREDAATGLLDSSGSAMMLSRIRGRIRHKGLEHVSPLAVSIILEIGREAVPGEARDEMLAEAEAALMQEALVVTMAMRRACPHEGVPARSGSAPIVFIADASGALWHEARAHARHRRPASREGLVLRAARHAAAAL